MLGADGVNAARDFSIEKQIAKQMLNEFKVSPDNTRVGLIQYGREPRLVARLDSNTDRRTLDYFIDTLSSSGGGIQMDKAFDMVRTALFTERYGSRRGVPKTIVVLTNKAVDASSQVAAEKVRDLGVKIIVIGVGQQVVKNQLKGIAGIDSAVMVVRSQEEVKNIVKDVAKSALPGMFITTYSRVPHTENRFFLFEI